MRPKRLWRRVNHHSPSEARFVLQGLLLCWGQLKTKRGGRNATGLVQKNCKKKHIPYKVNSKNVASRKRKEMVAEIWEETSRPLPILCPLLWAAQTMAHPRKTNRFQTSLLIKSRQLKNACETNHIRSVHINSEKRVARTTYKTEQKLTTRSPSSYLCSCK